MTVENGPWNINNVISRLEFIAQWAFYYFFPSIDIMQNVLSVFHYFLVTQMADWSQVCQFMYMVDYIECLHCQQLFC